MRLMLTEPFESLWQGKDPFEEVERLQGQVYRELEGRRTLRTEVAGRGYFVKIHRGIGWERLPRTCSRPRRRCLAPARNGEPYSASRKSACRP